MKIVIMAKFKLVLNFLPWSIEFDKDVFVGILSNVFKIFANQNLKLSFISIKTKKIVYITFTGSLSQSSGISSLIR